MLPLTKKQLKLHRDSTECCICWKRFLKKFANDKHYRKSYGPHIIYAIAHSICNLRFDVPLEIPVSFYSGSNYDNNFIINQLANEFEWQFECVEESTEKYKTSSVPIEKEVTNIDKDGNGSVVTISYKIKFIDSVRLWQVHYQIFLIMLLKEFTKLNVEIVIVFLNMKVSKTIWWSINAYLTIKIIQTNLLLKLKKWFKNTFKFSKNDINKFIL